MRIAILSWGSLIESGVARGLQTASDFSEGGPILPIEFSRISQTGERAGCLTLVIDEQNGVNVPTRYAVSYNINLDLALTNLRIVENISEKFHYTVGYVNLVRNTEREWARICSPVTIKEWARRHDFDAVIWTSLRSNFQKILEIPFTIDNAVQYVRNLDEPVKSKAMEYINESPVEIITPVRSALSNNNTVSPATTPEESESDRELTLRRFLNRVVRHR